MIEIYLIGECCDPFHPECIRAAAGNISHIPLYSIKSINTLSHYTFWKVDINASITIHDVPEAKNICFLLGSEQGFLEDDHLIPCHSFKIPMNNNVDSLNVAATSAIILYHWNTLKK